MLRHGSLLLIVVLAGCRTQSTAFDPFTGNATTRVSPPATGTVGQAVPYGSSSNGNVQPFQQVPGPRTSMLQVPSLSPDRLAQAGKLSSSDWRSAPSSVQAAAHNNANSSNSGNRVIPEGVKNGEQLIWNTPKASGVRANATRDVPDRSNAFAPNRTSIRPRAPRNSADRYTSPSNRQAPQTFRPQGELIDITHLPSGNGYTPSSFSPAPGARSSYEIPTVDEGSAYIDSSCCLPETVVTSEVMEHPSSNVAQAGFITPDRTPQSASRQWKRRQ